MPPPRLDLRPCWVEGRAALACGTPVRSTFAPTPPPAAAGLLPACEDDLPLRGPLLSWVAADPALSPRRVDLLARIPPPVPVALPAPPVLAAGMPALVFLFATPLPAPRPSTLPPREILAISPPPLGFDSTSLGCTAHSLFERCSNSAARPC